MVNFSYNLNVVLYSDRQQWFRKHNHSYWGWPLLMASLSMFIFIFLTLVNQKEFQSIYFLLSLIIFIDFFIVKYADYSFREKLATKFYITKIQLDGCNISLEYLDSRNKVFSRLLPMSEYSLIFEDPLKNMDLANRDNVPKGAFYIVKKNRDYSKSVIYDENPFNDSFYQYCVVDWTNLMIIRLQQSFNKGNLSV